ncbi:uncharacterized protein LOC133803341 [Humulus lupulus]|uniref:uncharacterized protein LOC133803341 n=1 Tax=Humulus lupulus TaxID=3486 RepID=UPI002B40934B|nr:uncharacterized protein LOC133803341 [Humulus lupulus]
MTTSKTPNTTSSQPIQQQECCMCGDYGFSYELFQCKVCQFRSQHRYCSNLYPNMPDSCRTCNWCLMTQNEDKTQHSSNSNSSSSCKNEDKTASSKTKMNNNSNNDHHLHHHQVGPLILRRQGIRPMNLQQLSGPIKKQKSVEIVVPPPPSPSPSPAAKSPSIRKRVLTNGAKEERLRRTRSAEISNAPTGNGNGFTSKQVFRSKVRRYKLLDEVSS